MSKDFSNIAILGGGLLGGSLALNLVRRGRGTSQVRLWARNPATVDAAKHLGILASTADLAEAIQGADLVVLAVPVGAMPGLVASALAAGLPAGCVVTDVGSVKRKPHLSISPLLSSSGVWFVGSHPMAGSEQGGLAAASADLFSNAACLLTNDEGAPSEICAELERFWQAVGCRTSWMGASIHDELVARISHLPHVVAASAARVCLKDPSEGRFGGGGLRDTTRVAAGNAEMWAEILMENREAISGPLRETIADLTAFLVLLEQGDQEATRQWLATAKHQRDFLNPVS